MDFHVEKGREGIHDHWFLWLHAETDVEAWAGNRAIDLNTKDLGRFLQIIRSHSVGVGDCGTHFMGYCPGTYGWEMWSLPLSEPTGDLILQGRLDAIKTKATELLTS